ncbi:uncharacterized [Tachysurus ichikawai]
MLGHVYAYFHLLFGLVEHNLSGFIGTLSLALDNQCAINLTQHKTPRPLCDVALATVTKLLLETFILTNMAAECSSWSAATRLGSASLT